MFLRTSILFTTFLTSLSASAFDITYVIGSIITDNDPVGFSDTQTIVAPEITEITDIEIGLTISGGWLGDLYGFVQHDSGFSVLLNRVGREAGNTLGSSADLLDVTFVTGGADIHVADAPFTGLFGPDGRETDPFNALDSDPRTADVDSFIGLPASGTWTLFLADLSPGDISTIENWSLEISGVPEPAAATAYFGAVILLFVATRRRR